MNKFYRKPKPETMRENRAQYMKLYDEQIKWFQANLDSLIKHKNKFLIEMYTILITGNRKVTPKMESAINNGIQRCSNDPRYNEDVKQKVMEKLKPILEKITLLEGFAATNNDRSLPFIKSVKEYIQKNHRVSKKQLEGLNKIYNKYK
tara:strand:+ start:647 stop:1090 length:444 start_codon:yes stop_codon:yes gene_type:complete